MATTAAAPQVRIRKRRIVERPRLFALLDDSKARVRMLVAPAGYGKTTLAEQWVARDGRQAAWYTARSASTDVAALALGIAKRATTIVEECDVRLRAHMRALPAPAENVQTLAEILGEDLAAWPPSAWLVIDDYHEVAQEPQAEAFVHALVSASPVQFLIASRVRPSWVTTKDRLYGEALEVSQTALAMDNREAADVLVERSEDAASGLVTLANGWPAVIGLASVSSAEIEDGVEAVPESLYRFFADEVFGALGAEVRQGLTTLAVAPVIDGQLAAAVLGEDGAETVTAAALDVGLLVERDGRLDLHPLARSFLEERSGQLGLRPSGDAAEICLGIYRERREWDAAFDLITRSQLTGHLEELMRSAIDELLEGARLSTLERWCEVALEADVDAPIFGLARAETMLRDGRHIEAIAHAEQAAAGDPGLEFRALAVGGRAAHIASREEQALALYERAEAAATSEAEVRDARWGQLVCLIDLELPSADAKLAELSAGVGFADPREVVRAAGHGVYLQLRRASLDLEEADTAYRLLPAVNDPLVESSFLSAYANALVLSARYEDALAATGELLERAERYRLDFALAYGLAGTAMAHTGLRQWRRAEDAALSALMRARSTRDINADLVARAVLLRLYAQQGQVAAALAVDAGRTRGALNATIGEFASSRALVLACAGRTREARELVDEVRGTTAVVELAVLSVAIEAVCALREGRADVIDQALRLEATAFQTGAVDMLVTSYRACPELLAILLRTSNNRRFRALVEIVGDHDLASAAGYPIAVNDDKRLLLTPREEDVFELLRTGLSNREIGRLLYIEESTVKAHTNRIYEKLGVHSRSALVIQAALERADHATSATDSSSESAS
jgi:ATP/maltotriose-dependent transcriptional regulator MalT